MNKRDVHVNKRDLEKNKREICHKIIRETETYAKE